MGREKRKTTKFQEKVYTLVKKIPKGKVTTYKAIAQALGSKGYRAIGRALNANPYAPYVPCHRVIKSDGSLGGFQGGIERKKMLLSSEGIVICDDRVANLHLCLWLP